MEKRGLLLPIGFRFNPTDEEIIIHYLLKKVIDSNFTALAISEADLNKCEPWDLPNKAKMGEGKQWYFFCQRDRKYSKGMRTNRATESGYWKATGKDREIFSNINKSSNNNNKKGLSSLVGMKKTLVFYKGRAPNGEKTNWVMHEYRLIDEGKNNYLSTYYNLFSKADDKDRWVVCRVIQRNDIGMSRRSQTSSTIKLARIDSFANRRLDNNDHYDGATLKLPPPPLTDFSNSCHDHGVEREFIDDDNIPSSSTSLSYYNDLESEIFVRQYDHDELKPNVLLPPHNADQIDYSTVCVHPRQQSPSMFEYNRQYFPFMNNAHVQRNLGFIPPSKNILMQSNNMSVIGHSQESGVSELNRNATNWEISYVENKKTFLAEGLGGVSFSPDISELVDSLWSS